MGAPMSNRRVHKDFMKYFLNLNDEELVSLVKEISGRSLNNYKPTLRSKEAIILSDRWDRVEIRECGIYFHLDCSPPYGVSTLRKFDRFFCIPC